MDSFSDLWAMTTPELNSFIKMLADQEAAISSSRAHSGEESEQTAADVSYQRRVLRGKLDISRAELVTRRRNDNDDGSASGAAPRSASRFLAHAAASSLALIAPASLLNTPRLVIASPPRSTSVYETTPSTSLSWGTYSVSISLATSEAFPGAHRSRRSVACIFVFLNCSGVREVSRTACTDAKPRTTTSRARHNESPRNIDRGSVRRVHIG